MPVVSGRPAGRHGPALRDRARPQAARDRGRRAGVRLDAGSGERIGAIGDIVSFSFHANKNVTSIEGGALVLNNEDEAELARKYRLQGITRTGFDGMDCDVLGGKYNLTDVAARVGLGQLPQLERFTAQAPRARARLLRRVRRRRGGQARRRPAGRRTSRTATGTCSRSRCRSRSSGSTRAGFMARDEGARHRHGRALSGDPSVHAVSRARLQGRHVPACGALRRDHGHAAALHADERRTTSSTSSKSVDEICEQFATQRVTGAQDTKRDMSYSDHSGDVARSLGHHPGVQRGSRPGRALRAPVSGARRARHVVRGRSSSTTAAATNRPRCSPSSSARGPTPRA